MLSCGQGQRGLSGVGSGRHDLLLNSRVPAPQRGVGPVPTYRLRGSRLLTALLSHAFPSVPSISML